MLLGLGGALAVLFVAIVVLSVAGGDTDEPAFSIELTPTGRILDVEAGDVTVTERDAGVQLDIDAFTLPERTGGQFYDVVLELRDGSELGAGSFSLGFGVLLTVGVDIDDIAEIRIVATGLGDEATANDTVLKGDFPTP